MNLTKWEHACMVLERNGQTLVIDPGGWTTPLTEVRDVVGVVITHEHSDHWTPEQLERILEFSPDAKILGTPATASAAAQHGITVEAVHPGESVTVGQFELRFFGGRHAIIHSSIPQIDNVGVLVNERFYYAGDSFSAPEGIDVDLLAAPSAAPWMRLAESMDFVIEVKPHRVMAVHDAILSRAGKDLSNGRLEWAVQQVGGEFVVMEPGDTITV